MEHYRKLERMYQAAPINEYFRPQLTVGAETAEVRIPVREAFFHTGGAMHGSVYFKAMDDAAFFAANSIVEDVFVLTARFEIQFLAPVRGGEVRAVGRVREKTDRRIVATAELFDKTDTLVGRGEGSFARSKISLNSTVQYR